MALKEVYFKLTGESVIPYRGDDLYLRSKDFEYDVKTYLIITCSSASVSYSTGTESLHVLQDFKSLKYAL